MAETAILDLRGARRLALTRAGLLGRRSTGLPEHASGGGKRARDACHALIRRFGYLQLDTVSIAGARSHALVLLSRFEGLDPELPERLLRAGEPLFEYWGHEACWMPIELYSTFGFRRQRFRHHPWWGDIVAQHPELTERVRQHIANDGPVRAAQLEGRGRSGGWWDLKASKKVATALWSSGELAIAERSGFQRLFDLAEKVIPADVFGRDDPLEAALETLLLRALAGHGWATTGTLAATWRLRNLRPEIHAALDRLVERGKIVACTLSTPAGQHAGWIQPRDLETIDRLRRQRPRRDRGVLLSPFDPLIWDRQRTLLLFDFKQVLEIFKPAAQRVYGYYCLPILAGDRLIGRVDMKAHRRQGRLEILALHHEATRPNAVERQAVACALDRHADALGLKLA